MQKGPRRCPKCMKETVSYDVTNARMVCSNCGWEKKLTR